MYDSYNILSDSGTLNKPAIFRHLCEKIFSHKRENRIAIEKQENALIVMEELVKTAKKTVDIYCNGDEIHTWGTFRLVSEILDAADDGVKFRVFVRHPPHKVVKNLFIKAKATMKMPVEEYEERVPQCNVILVDGEAFFYETMHPKRKGFAYAKNEKMAESMRNIIQGVDAVSITI